MRLMLLALMVLLAFAVGCGEQKQAEAPKKVQPTPPGNIRASHILIAYQGASRSTAVRSKEEARKLADELLEHLKSGENFEELARSYSDCTTAPKGGDLGFFTRGRMVKPFEDAAFGLKVGEISGVVETDFGYHIIKRTQ